MILYGGINMHTIDKYSDMLSIKEVCEYLCISRYTAYKLLQNKKIKYVKIGNKFLVTKNSLAKFLGVE